ncbi:hypothetical protein [Tamlana sp. I1]|uniref:hypothetical protein n=1 Tax=Tamlana sp. I1 TaxID=2762061 RepID=UPI00188DCA01|nr:hypothetical protein [Tamlana sp. I1]
MKSYVLYILMILFSLSGYSQIDSRKKSFSIPAVEAPKAPSEVKPIEPEKEENKELDFELPKPSQNLDFPKKEFSMFSDEQFGDPGELYIDNINKNIEDIRLSKRELELRNGSSVDQFLGDFNSKAKSVNVVYRDHGYPDGDVIQVLVNDDIVHARIFLNRGFQGFKLELQPGINKIDFLALNQGQSGPNTAEFKVMDDTGAVITHDQWNLSTGVKATVIITKE